MELALIFALAALVCFAGALTALGRAYLLQSGRLERELARAGARLEVAAKVRGELDSRVAELEAELEARSAGPDLEGRYVIVNTPKPDDQSFRGWVRREYPGGELELTNAELLEPGPDGTVVAQPAGTVLVERHSWLGLDAIPPSSE